MAKRTSGTSKRTGGQAEYHIILRDDRGKLLTQLDDYLGFSVLKTVNDIGKCELTIPFQAINHSWIQVDMQIEFWRSVDGMPFQLLGYSPFLLQKWEEALQTDGTWNIVLHGVDPLDLLSRRVVAAPSGQPGSDKEGHADDLLQTYVRENGGDLGATGDAARMFYHFKVVGFGQQGAYITKSAANRDLLSLCQELCAASFAGGMYLAFDITPVSPGSNYGWLQLRTYPGWRGVDHRMYPYQEGVGRQFVLSPENGSLAEIVRGWDWTDTETLITVKSTGQQQAPITTTRKTKGANKSVHNRREVLHHVTTHDHASTLTGGNPPTTTATDQVTTDVQMFSYARRIVRTFSARLVETDDLKFGRDYNLGDYVTCQAGGDYWNVRLDQVSVRVENRTEDIAINLRADFPDDSIYSDEVI